MKSQVRNKECFRRVKETLGGSTQKLNILPAKIQAELSAWVKGHSFVLNHLRLPQSPHSSYFNHADSPISGDCLKGLPVKGVQLLSVWRREFSWCAGEKAKSSGFQIHISQPLEEAQLPSGGNQPPEMRRSLLGNGSSLQLSGEAGGEDCKWRSHHCRVIDKVWTDWQITRCQSCDKGTATFSDDWKCFMGCKVLFLRPS